MALFHSKSIGVWQRFPFPKIISVLLLFLTKDKSSQKHSISVSSRGDGAGVHIWCFQFLHLPYKSSSEKQQVVTTLWNSFPPPLPWSITGFPEPPRPLAGVVSLWSATAQVWQALTIRPIALMPLPAKPCESKWAWVTELERVRRIWDSHFIAFPGY